MMTVSLRAVTWVSALVLVLATGWASAQGKGGQQSSPGAARKSSREQTSQRTTSWVKVVTQFTRGVQIEEKDVQSYLENFESFQQLMGDDEEWNVEVLDKKRGFEMVLQDRRYLEWARSRGLDPDSWLRKSMRIVMLSLAEELEQAAAGNLEESKKEAKEKGGRAKGRSAEEEALEAVRGIPGPAQKEKALLAKHKEKLKGKAMSDK